VPFISQAKLKLKGANIVNIPTLIGTDVEIVTMWFEFVKTFCMLSRKLLDRQPN